MTEAERETLGWKGKTRHTSHKSYQLECTQPVITYMPSPGKICRNLAYVEEQDQGDNELELARMLILPQIVDRKYQYDPRPCYPISQ